VSDPEEEDFAAMFEASLQAKRLEKGEMVEGKIVTIGPEVALVDVGGKGEAVIQIDELRNADGEVEVSHSGFLYLVGDDGKLLVTWPFGTSSEDMAADVEQLFEAQAAAR